MTDFEGIKSRRKDSREGALRVGICGDDLVGQQIREAFMAKSRVAIMKTGKNPGEEEIRA